MIDAYQQRTTWIAQKDYLYVYIATGVASRQ